MHCSQSEAVELQKELQHEYGYSLAQLTEVAGLGSAAAIVKVCVRLLFIVTVCELMKNTPVLTITCLVASYFSLLMVVECKNSKAL